jgi:NitT/TauT family transport system permease protein
MEYLEVDRRPGPTEPAHSELKVRASLAKQLAHRLRPGAAAGFALLVLALWELGVRTGVIEALHFPAPTTIASTVGKLLASGQLQSHILATLRRVAWGVGIGGTLGLGFGLAMGRSRRWRAALDPVVGALHPLPKIAILPLIMVLFGIGDLTLVVVIAAGSFFPMVINTAAGVAQINPIHFDIARIHRATRMRVMRRVVLPGAAPSVLAGLRLALNTALLITVAVEMVAARRGLGAMIWMSWTTLRTEEIYVALLATIVFGLTVNLALSLLARFALPWQRQETA